MFIRLYNQKLIMFMIAFIVLINVVSKGLPVECITVRTEHENTEFHESKDEVLGAPSCAGFTIKLIATSIACAGARTGSIRVELSVPADSLYFFQWSHGAKTINVDNLSAGQYTFTAAIIDEDGEICMKTATATIQEPDLQLFISTEPQTACNLTNGKAKIDGFILTPLQGILPYRCEAPITDFNLDCSSGVPIAGISDTVIHAGDTMVISPGELFNGALNMDGGILKVCGYFIPTSFQFSGGTIILSGSMSDDLMPDNTTFSIGSGAKIINYGSLNFKSLIVNGVIENYNKISIIGDLSISIIGSYLSKGVTYVDGKLNNLGTINNYQELRVLKLENSALLNNYCTIVVGENFVNNSIFNHEGSIRVVNEVQNKVGAIIRIIEGSEFVAYKLVNYSKINASGASCYCFKVTHGSKMRPESMIEGAGMASGPSGNSTCGCITEPGLASFIVNGQKVKELTNLAAGSHTVMVDYGFEECPFEAEINIGGGFMVEATQDHTICFGETTRVEAGAHDGSDEDQDAGYIYNWTPTTGLINYQPGNSQAARPEITTTYSVEAIDNVRNCSATTQVTVTVNPNMMLDAGVDQTICLGQNAQLEAKAIGSNLSFVWTPAKGLSDTKIANPIATPLITTTYKVRVIDTDGGCYRVDSVKVTVNPLPVVKIEGPSSKDICYGGGIDLLATGGTSYSWSPSQGLSNANIANPRANPLQNTRYTVTSSNDLGCPSTASVDINILPAPLSTSVAVDPKVCLGEAQQLVATGGISYEWSPTAGLSNPHIANPAVTVSEATEYTVAITGSNNCLKEEKIIVSPLKWADAGKDTLICFGQTTQLNAIGKDAQSYRWYPTTGLSNPNIPNPLVSVNSTMKYTVEITNIYGCKHTDLVFVRIDPACRCSQSAPTGTLTFSWTGEISSDWNNPGNWSTKLTNLTRVPGDEPGDNVVIGTTGLTQPKLDKTRIIGNLCVLSGKIDLQQFTLQVEGDATLTGGEITQSNNVGTLPLLYINGKNISSVIISGTLFNASLKVEKAESVYLNGSVFNKEATIEQTGTKDVFCNGGNIFNGDETILINSGTGNWYLAYYASGSKDIYNSNTTFKKLGTGEIYPNCTFEDAFKKDINIGEKPVVFGINGGVTSISGKADQTIGGGSAASAPIFKNLKINKDVTSQLSYVTLNVPVTAGNAVGDSLTFIKGIIISSKINILTIPAATKVKGASDISFVHGPVQKIGNESFVFPIGKDDAYMPLSISNAANSDADAPFIAEFFFGEQTWGSTLGGNLKHVSTCEYWSLTGPANTPKIKVSLSWTPLSCDIPTDLKTLQVARWNDSGSKSEWYSHGNGGYTGSRLTGGTLSSKELTNQWGHFILGSTITLKNSPIVGVSLNNYGANIRVGTNTMVNVYGNVLNESDYKEKSGLIVNEGNIKVRNDWTNNEKNEGLDSITGKGAVEMVGSAQRFRGAYPTSFFNLVNDGAGIKEMYNNVNVTGVLDLKNNQFATKGFTLFIKNNDSNAILRGTGFISSEDGGFLKRNIDLTKTQFIYLFPVGAYQIYRPVELVSVKGSETKAFSVKMVPHNPDIDGLDRTIKTASIKDMNDKFYHIIQKGDSAINNNYSDSLKVTMYFNKKEDGSFQSIGHWDNKADSLPAPFKPRQETNIWKKAGPTSVASSKNTITPNSISLSNWADFSNPQFVLGKGAFIINTFEFGNTLPGASTSYTMSGENFDEAQPVYETDEFGDDEVGNSVGPDNLAGTHTMEIKGDVFTLPGKLAITTDSDGKITEVAFLDKSNNPQPLADDLFTIINGNILVLKSEPANKIDLQKNPITISFSNEDPLVFYRAKTPQEFLITGIDMNDPALSFTIINNSDKKNFSVNGASIITWWNGQDIQEGSYSYELKVSLKGGQGTHIFKGQFIVMQ